MRPLSPGTWTESGWQTSLNWSFTAAWSTTYLCEVRARNSVPSTTAYGSRQTVAIGAEPTQPAPATPPRPSATVTGQSVAVSVGTSARAVQWRMRRRIGTGGYTRTGWGSGRSWTFTGAYSTTYEISVQARNSDNVTSDWSSTRNATIGAAPQPWPTPVVSPTSRPVALRRISGLRFELEADFSFGPISGFALTNTAYAVGNFDWRAQIRTRRRGGGAGTWRAVAAPGRTLIRITSTNADYRMSSVLTLPDPGAGVVNEVDIRWGVRVRASGGRVASGWSNWMEGDTLDYDRG